MPAPGSQPVWATVTSNIQTPSTGQQQSGWNVNQIPPSKFQNWWQNLVYQWTNWLGTVFTDPGDASTCVITPTPDGGTGGSTKSLELIGSPAPSSPANRAGGVVVVQGGTGNGTGLGGSLLLQGGDDFTSSGKAQLKLGACVSINRANEFQWSQTTQTFPTPGAGAQFITLNSTGPVVIANAPDNAGGNTILNTIAAPSLDQAGLSKFMLVIFLADSAGGSMNIQHLAGGGNITTPGRHSYSVLGPNSGDSSSALFLWDHVHAVWRLVSQLGFT